MERNHSRSWAIKDFQDHGTQKKSLLWFFLNPQSLHAKPAFPSDQVAQRTKAG
jgi:hypothetical protein